MDDEKRKMMKKIQELKKKMDKIIQERPSLIDNEVVKISQEVDVLLNKYHEMKQ
ncbi:Spo0E like sporulation regulatory protein [Natronincola peptidivorans]|uniref:Spo0E like sporulation regulatory protein n=1 Tax=Natronincola peptidivorans TaxID=426128 RepID=A0A1I0F9A4_9FIRM|nr:aspartyl-phosphate phosphatase Spo0E family protein [Natronincola peptidivorans]SET54500.1 Spo0E like sporulation regulatory protein [Natronincola peptidivorans]